MGFWIFMGVAIGIAALILSVIGWVNRCKECGNVGHAFSSEKVSDFDSGKAFVVCKRCGARKHQGTVSADGSVMWFGGGTGTFDEDGSYQSDSGGYGDGGDGGGGGGE